MVFAAEVMSAGLQRLAPGHVDPTALTPDHRFSGRAGRIPRWTRAHPALDDDIRDQRQYDEKKDLAQDAPATFRSAGPRLEIIVMSARQTGAGQSFAAFEPCKGARRMGNAGALPSRSCPA